MRRRAYPYGRYMIRDRSVEELGPELKSFIKDIGFYISKYDTSNEGDGVLIVSVNKTVRELLKQKKPPGKLKMILSTFSFTIPSMKDLDEESQRVGMELYLWPVEDGTLLEVFILPYMEHLDRPEIFGLTESEEEEITEWYLCEHTWEHVIPMMKEQFDMEKVHRRG
ncbi:MAG: hypothetical protein ACOC53_07040 [Candidatus Saliniplasma sp.]